MHIVPDMTLVEPQDDPTHGFRTETGRTGRIQALHNTGTLPCGRRDGPLSCVGTLGALATFLDPFDRSRRIWMSVRDGGARSEAWIKRPQR